MRHEHWQCHFPLPKGAHSTLSPVLAPVTPGREFAQDLLPGLMEWILSIMNVQKHSVVHSGGKGWEIRETPAFSMSGMVQGDTLL